MIEPQSAQLGASSWILNAVRSALSEAAMALTPAALPLPFARPFLASATGRSAFAEAVGGPAWDGAVAVAVAVAVVAGGSFASSIADGPSPGRAARAAPPKANGAAPTAAPRSWIPSAARASPARNRDPSQRKM